MRLAFYKAACGDWTDKLISLRTMSPFSHVELIFDTHAGISCSSSIRDGGVRFSRIDFNSGKWVVLEIHNTNENEAYSYCNELLGKSYDLMGMLAMGFQIAGCHSPNCYFCSELILGALQRQGIFVNERVEPSMTSPHDLFLLALGREESYSKMLF